jgi:predicted lipoprotein with Yx(FWY)xxD motif
VNGKTCAFALLAVAAALIVAGCGSASSSSGGYGGESSASETSGGSGGAYGGGAYGGSGGGETAASNASGTTAQVSTGSAKDVGEVLVDANGMTLYYFEGDKKGSGKSSCNGACAEAWPPLLSEGEAQAMSGAQSSMLGTIERGDGTTQVTYAGWPLYTFVEDKKPGEDNGTDSKAFGASWYPLHPNGKKAGS